jgi:hypothetical protein
LITIRISRPARRSRIGTDRSSISSSFTPCDGVAGGSSSAPSRRDEQAHEVSPYGLWKGRQKGSPQSNYRLGASDGGPETDEKGSDGTY